MRRFFKLGLPVLVFAALPFVWVGLIRPPRTDTTSVLFDGILYTRRVLDEPRSAIVHIVEIDLATADPAFLVTPPLEDGSFAGRTTEAFLAEFDLQLAVNGGFFQAPSPGRLDNLRPLGLVISSGETAVSGRANWPVICFTAAGQAVIRENNCPGDTVQALAGNVIFVDQGAPIPLRSTWFPGRQNSYRPAPRTVVALDEAGTRLWLVVVDGRQRGYSQGLTLAELAEFLVELGAFRALNLDGGGSSTLAVRRGRQVSTLNAPIDGGIPMRQRPVPTHLGIRAEPIAD